jgi:hypothetical protein
MNIMKRWYAMVQMEWSDMTYFVEKIGDRWRLNRQSNRVKDDSDSDGEYGAELSTQK